MLLTKFRINADGTETILWTSAKPYELRRPKGLSVHAKERLFITGKVRYRRYRGVLVMAVRNGERENLRVEESEFRTSIEI
jgi:hypothetical protein